MAEEDLLPKSLENLEIDSLSLSDSESQPTLESLTLCEDDCPQESCKCNKKSQTCDRNTGSAWNRRRFVQKPFSSQLSSTQNLGIIRKSRFKSSNARSKTWILREPVLKLESLTRKEEIRSHSSSASPVRLDKKPSGETPSEISKLSLGQGKSKVRVFGACTSVTPSDFSRLCPSKSSSQEVKEAKQFTATSYRHIRFSTPSQPSKVVKRKKDHRKEGTMKTRPNSDTANTHSVRQASSHPSGSQSTTCSQQARMVGTSHVSSGSDDVTIDELASYFDLFVHIPRKMSHMAENMYI